MNYFEKSNTIQQLPLQLLGYFGSSRSCTPWKDGIRICQVMRCQVDNVPSFTKAMVGKLIKGLLAS